MGIEKLDIKWIVSQLKRHQWQILRTCLLAVIWEVIAMLFIVFGKRYFFMGINAIQSLPDEVTILFGVPAGKIVGNAGFLLLFIWMFYTTWFAYKTCMGIVFYVDSIENNGSIYLHGNQIYHKIQLFLQQIFAFLMEIFEMYLILFGVSILFGMVFSGNWTQSINFMQAMLYMGIRSFFVIIMFGMVSAFFASFKLRFQSRQTFTELFIFGTLLIGNLYKIFPLLKMGMEYIDRDAKWCDTWYQYLKNLYWISPMSWVNPFSSFEPLQLAATIGISIGIALLAIVCACVIFYRREF